MGASQSQISSQSPTITPSVTPKTPNVTPKTPNVTPKTPNVTPKTNSKKTELRVKPLTTYLGYLFKKNNIDVTQLEYNGKSIKGAASYKNIIGNYESALTQAVYFSRLAYELNAVISAMTQFVDYNPVVFNTALSLIRNNYSRFKDSNIKVQNIGKTVIEGNIDYVKKGLVETPCYLQILDYTKIKENCPYPGERVLYVAFRGTISLKSALTDVKTTPASLSKLFKVSDFNGMNGMNAFKPELDNTEGAMFSSHFGFIENLEPIIGIILKQIEEHLQKDGPINKIIVTGHSLGGANATLFAMVLAGFKKANVEILKNTSIHCITFGAPKLLSDYSRNVFNSMLDNNILTLDRVANRIKSLAGVLTGGISMDIVPTIPPNFDHPGYMILKLERNSREKTGRSKNISEIREMLSEITSDYTFNELPTYSEFLSNFNQIAVKNYKTLLTTKPLATLYASTKGSEYITIKDLVTKVIKGVTDLSADQIKDLSADQIKEQEKIADSPPADDENAIHPPQNSQKGGGVQTDKYKKDTVERGPNHVVYTCQKNISHASCHMGYMGVSFWGGLKNISLGRAPQAKIHIDNIKGISMVVITDKASSNIKGGKRRNITKRKKRYYK